MRLRLAASVLVAAAVAAPPAAAQWSPPQDVSGPGTATGIVTVAYAGGGDGLLVWSAQPGPFYGTATLPAGSGSWRPGPWLPKRLAYLHAHPAVALYGRSRALLLAPRRERSGGSLRYTMIAAFGRADGTFAEPRVLDAGAVTGASRAPRSLSTPSLSVSATGDVIGAWSRDDGRTSAIRVLEREAGGPLEAVRTRSPRDARVPAAALSERGDRVVAWYRRGYVEARVRRRGGAWGSVLRVARSRHTPSALQAAVGPDGRVVLAWGTIDERPGRESLLTFDAAARPRHAGWTSQRLDRYRAHGASFSGAQRQVHVAFDTAGRGLVGWQGRGSDGATFAVARLRDDGTFARPEIAGPVPARPSDLVVGPGGRVAAVWWQETGRSVPASLVRVAISRGDVGFAAPETLPVSCPAAFICLPSDARSAFDPVTGRPTVAWIQRDDANHRVWVSTRPAP